jgi:hypothetical protein
MSIKPMRRLAPLFFAVGLLRAQSPAPTLQQYLATRQASIPQVYASIAGSQIKLPVFGAQLQALFEVYCGQPAPYTLGCSTFTVQEAENQIDMLVSMGAAVLEVNISPWIYADDQTASITARAYIDTVLTYLSSKYPTINLTINPGLLAENLALAKDNSGNWTCGHLAGSSGGGNYMSAPSDGTGADISTCMTTARSWLTISATNYGVYGYLAKKYAPYRFTVMHEMSSNNANYGWTPSSVGTTASWATFVGNMMTIVYGLSPASRLGIAMDRFDGPYQTALIGATCTPSPCALQYVGQDVYSDDIWNTTNGLGVQAIMIAGAQGAGLETMFSEMWSPSWSPATLTAGDGNAYEGAGNCDWRLYDVDRQELTALSMWAAGSGITEIQFFDASTVGAACVYNGTLSSGVDRIANQTYATAVANGSLQRTPLFYFLQSLIKWFPVIQAGAPLPI